MATFLRVKKILLFYANFFISLTDDDDDGIFTFRFLLRPKRIRPERMSRLRPDRMLLRPSWHVRTSSPVEPMEVRQYLVCNVQKHI